MYKQAQFHAPAPERVRRWLAQLAQALAVLHAQGAVHRDLKGDNVLVRRSDDRAMLMDFGTGLYPSAAALTPAMGFPVTPLYRSPQSWLFEIQFHGSSTARYRPCPADDLYALGVTACRLLTGEYPELYEPFHDEYGTWHLKSVRLSRSFSNPLAVDSSLRPLILRLLSVNPEQRGTAEQLAQELEPVSPVRPPQPDIKLRAPRRYGWPWLPAAAGLALTLGKAPTASHESPEQPLVASADPARADSPDAGTVGIGDAATVVALDQPPPGSTNEATIEAVWEPEQCQEQGGQMFKGSCYVPFFLPGRKRPPTSDP